MRIVAVVVVIWLLIGVVAAAQRHYFSNADTNCAHAGRVVATVLAGPLNYVGVNPKVDCHLPQPSK
jgi:membrane protein YdbS with pleckstrin-like domain